MSGDRPLLHLYRDAVVELPEEAAFAVSEIGLSGSALEFFITFRNGTASAVMTIKGLPNFIRNPRVLPSFWRMTFTAKGYDRVSLYAETAELFEILEDQGVFASFERHFRAGELS